jgi:polysaccharide export outer membrane protein
VRPDEVRPPAGTGPPGILPEGTDPSLFFSPPPSDLRQYRLGPEDVLSLRVFELPQLNVRARVAGDGTIDLPLVGRVPVAGLTASNLAEQLTKRLSDKLDRPQVSVLIEEFNSRRVFLLGAVRRPDAYPLKGLRTLLQQLAEAGGFTAEAGDHLYVFRGDAQGTTARLRVPLRELQHGDDPRYDIWLRPGDLVSVPPAETITVSVLGAIRTPGIYEMLVDDSPTLLKAIAKAGGLAELASESGIKVIRRRPTGADALFEIDMKEVVNGKSADLPLEDGDLVIVKESFW